MWTKPVWPVRNRCFRCACPKGHDPTPSAAPPPYNLGPTGRPPQRSNPVSPTYRPNQRPSKPNAPAASVQNFPPLAQPLPAGLVAPGAAPPPFPVGSLDWLKGFLQTIMSLEDFEKYKGKIDPTPQKVEVPFALQLAKKIKERGSVLVQIEREQVLVGDCRTKNERHTEILTELMERTYSLQRDIDALGCGLGTAAKCPCGPSGSRSTAKFKASGASGASPWASASCRGSSPR